MVAKKRLPVNRRTLSACGFCATIGLYAEVQLRRKKYVFWLVFGIFSIIAAAKTVTVESRWQKTPIQIDGDIGDWMAPLFQSEKSVQVDYAFCNDADNLHLVFIFKEQKFLSSLAQTGFTLWFNDQGKKKKKLGLRFEKKSLAAAELISVLEKKSGPLPEERKKEILAKPAYLVNQFVAIDGDNKDQTGMIFKQPPLPEFTALSAFGRLAFEFRIPIGLGNGLNLAPGKTVMVGFDWGGSTKEMRKALIQDGGYEGGSEHSIESLDLDPEAQERGSSGLPSLRGPKHYVFWCQLTLAAESK